MTTLNFPGGPVRLDGMPAAHSGKTPTTLSRAGSIARDWQRSLVAALGLTTESRRRTALFQLYDRMVLVLDSSPQFEHDGAVIYAVFSAADECRMSGCFDLMEKFRSLTEATMRDERLLG
jgi:hypothetical protein